MTIRLQGTHLNHRFLVWPTIRTVAATSIVTDGSVHQKIQEQGSTANR